MFSSSTKRGVLERNWREGRMDSTLKGGTMKEYVSSLLSCGHRVRGISATREDEKRRVNVSVAHSSNPLYIKTELPSSAIGTLVDHTKSGSLDYIEPFVLMGDLCGQMEGWEVMGRD